MNLYFLAAGCLAFVIGLIHSVLGEVRIFRGLLERNTALAETPVLKKSHLGILRVTWHISTLFGCALGVLMLWLSRSDVASEPFVKVTLVSAFLLASVLTLLGTKARHPGWIGLLVVTVLVWLS